MPETDTTCEDPMALLRNRGRTRPESGSHAADRPVVERHEPGLRDRVELQHARFGGMKWGAAFFGWLSAMGLAALLVSLAAAAGVGVGLTEDAAGSVDQAVQGAVDAVGGDAETVGLVGGIVLLVVLGLAYYAGGYVAGRMARFDGARQGVAVWLIGVLVTVALAVAGAIFGAEYNLLGRLDLPRIPVDEGTATTGAIVALVAVALVTLVAAVLGGKVGEHFHRKVDRAGSL